MIKFLSDDIA